MVYMSRMVNIARVDKQPVFLTIEPGKISAYNQQMANAILNSKDAESLPSAETVFTAYEMALQQNQTGSVSVEEYLKTYAKNMTLFDRTLLGE